MRFLSVPTIRFIDSNGTSFAVKDIRPITVFDTMLTFEVKASDLADEIMSRTEYYGAGNEDLAWALVDHNSVAFAEANFDISLIRNLKMPVVESF